MLILLVTESKEALSQLQEFISLRDVHIIHYSNPVKAQDNLKELRPNLVFCSADEYPRHWKLLLKYTRDLYSRERTPFILFSREAMDVEEADKAHYLKVNAVLTLDWRSPKSKKALEKIFLRYFPEDFLEAGESPSPEESSWLCYLKIPSSNVITAARVVAMNQQYLLLEPDSRKHVADLKQGELLQQVSLKKQEKISDMYCRVEKNSSILLLKIIQLIEKNEEVET